MRQILLSLLAVFTLLPAAAAAADWGRYENGRYGYGIAVPPGFAGQGESDSGDGQVFRSGNGRETLTVWGGYLMLGDFGDEVEATLAGLKDEGWSISYQASSPRWASFSGTRGGTVLYGRMVAACDGYATFRLEYPQADLARFDPIVERLVQSLGESGCP